MAIGSSYGGPVRTLWLLRHAKSRWGDDSLPDHQRPLDARGRDAALRMGRHLRAGGARPELVLCSSALRTRETLDLLGEALGADLPARIERGLYLASAGEILSRIQAAPDASRGLMVIGHNPGLGELAALLAQSGPVELRRELRRKYPTCALCELRVGSAHWGDLPEGCELVDFVLPRTLPGLSSSQWTKPAKSS